MVKNPPGMQEMQARSLGQEEPLEKGMDGYTLQYSRLENFMDRGDWEATVYGGHKESDTTEATNTFHLSKGWELGKQMTKGHKMSP